MFFFEISSNVTALAKILHCNVDLMQWFTTKNTSILGNAFTISSQVLWKRLFPQTSPCGICSCRQTWSVFTLNEYATSSAHESNCMRKLKMASMTIVLQMFLSLTVRLDILLVLSWCPFLGLSCYFLLITNQTVISVWLVTAPGKRYWNNIFGGFSFSRFISQ